MIYGEMEVRCTEVELSRAEPDEECLLGSIPSLCETIRAAWKERDEMSTELCLLRVRVKELENEFRRPILQAAEAEEARRTRDSREEQPSGGERHG